MPPAARKRIDVAGIRRQQIVEAAVAVIAEQGIQNLSLSEIENKIGMSRGQLTYYFKTKEDILLAVFDRLVEMMRQQGGEEKAEARPCFASWEDALQMVLGAILQRPPLHPEFGPLQYTFLSQIGHREDFRERLARLYEEWRGHMAELVSAPLQRRTGRRKFAPRTVASLIQAIFHGVAIQVAAEPNAFERQEMVELCLDVLSTYLGTSSVGRNGHQPPSRKRSSARPSLRPHANGVKR